VQNRVFIRANAPKIRHAITGLLRYAAAVAERTSVVSARDGAKLVDQRVNAQQRRWIAEFAHISAESIRSADAGDRSRLANYALKSAMAAEIEAYAATIRDWVETNEEILSHLPEVKRSVEVLMDSSEIFLSIPVLHGAQPENAAANVIANVLPPLGLAAVAACDACWASLSGLPPV
jgi:hypothetical protein